jgi:hypothetical protein
MARGILLDTSAWICYLRPRGWDDLKTAVQQVLTAHSEPCQHSRVVNIGDQCKALRQVSCLYTIPCTTPCTASKRPGQPVLKDSSGGVPDMLFDENSHGRIAAIGKDYSALLDHTR